MVKLKRTVEEIRGDVKFWLTIITVIVSITAWGLRLEGRVDRLSDKIDNTLKVAEENKNHINTLTASLNEVWKEVVTLNALH